jgi:hypothetical protein
MREFGTIELWLPASRLGVRRRMLRHRRSHGPDLAWIAPKGRGHDRLVSAPMLDALAASHRLDAAGIAV